MPVVMEEKDPTPVPQELPSDAGDSRGEEAALDDSSSYIPLQRVVVTMQYSRQNNAMVLMEGWMVHYTNRNPVVRGVGWESPLNLNLVAILVMDIVFHVQSVIVVLLHLFCHTAQEAGTTGSWTQSVSQCIQTTQQCTSTRCVGWTQFTGKESQSGMFGWLRVAVR